MLLELKVTHFAIIDKLEVHFLRPGLNILTGETGAGKSVLLKSLSLLLGGKGQADVIRAGQEQAEIEGAFDLSGRPDIRKVLKDLDLEAGEEILVIRRIINRSGKHRVYINGYLSTLNILEQIVPSLVEITGQHEHHSLVRPQSQLELLDKFGGTMAAREKFSLLLAERKKIETKLDELKNSVKDREQRIDFLSFQIAEIENFKPVHGEDQELATSYQKARFSARLGQFAQNAEDILYGQENSVHGKIADLLREGDPLAEIDPALKQAVTSLREISAITEDAAFSFRDYSKKNLGSVDNPGEVEKIEERLSDLKKLQRKYGATVESIIEFKNRAKEEFETLQSSEESISAFQKQIDEINKTLKLQGDKLHNARKKAAVEMSSGVNSELKDLNMKGAEFSIHITKEEQVSTYGFDDVTFMIKPAPQESARALSKIASGGEQSRIMLALKQVVSLTDLPMTYLFDEVDTGVSGPTAEKVGRKLKSIGKVHQVISITHLPQVASFADAHFLINKEVIKGLIKSDVSELTDKQRVQELGRLISGEKITATSLAHARQMLEASNKHH